MRAQTRHNASCNCIEARVSAPVHLRLRCSTPRGLLRAVFTLAAKTSWRTGDNLRTTIDLKNLTSKTKSASIAKNTSTIMAVDITVASRGDVIFKLGKEGETVTKVLISSLVMSLSSPVFDAMFNGNFAEGQARLHDQPREVALPDDDTQAMLLVFRIAHMRTSDLSEGLSIDTFADFALVCDKYQCTGAVQAWSKLWIAKIFESAPAADFEKVVLAIYMLDMAQEFYKATRSLVRDRVADIKVIEHDHAVEAMFQALQADKCSIEALVYANLDTATKGLGYCELSKATLGSFIVALRTAGIWPYQAQSILRMKDGITQMTPIPQELCKSRWCQCKDVRDIKIFLTTQIGSIYDSVEGLCLDCIKRQHLGITGKCRVGHKGMKTE